MATATHAVKTGNSMKKPIELGLFSSARNVATQSAIRVNARMGPTGTVLTDKFNRIAAMYQEIELERIDGIIRAHIEAAMPLQEGVRIQAELVGSKIIEALKHIPMFTAREVANKVKSTSGKPEALTAQWVSRKRIFGVELAGHGVRYPGFQFQLSGNPWPALAGVLPTLLKEFDPIHLVLWFDTPHPALDGQKPLEVLHSKEKMVAAVHATLKPIDAY